MKNLYLLLFIIFNSIANGQIMFQKEYNDSQSLVYSVIEVSSGGYLYAGSIGTSIGNRANLIRTDVSGEIIWTKYYSIINDRASTVIEANDGGFIVAGSVKLGSQFDFYIMKIDSTGNIQWQKTYGGNKDEIFPHLIMTSTGELLLMGSTRSFGGDPFDLVCLIKTDISGNVIWVKTYEGLKFDRGNNVEETADGGYLLAGGTSSFTTNITEDAFLIETDTSGNIIWSKTYGSTGLDIASVARQSNDGGFIIAGKTTSLIDNYSDISIIKTDSIGNLIWTRSYGGIYYEGSSYINAKSVDIIQTNDNGYIISSSTNSFGNGFDVLLFKIDSIGNIEYTKTYGSYQEEGNGIISMIATSDGGYCISGYNSVNPNNHSKFYIIKTDSYGNSGCRENSPNLPIKNIINTSNTVSFIVNDTIIIPGSLNFTVSNWFNFEYTSCISYAQNYTFCLGDSITVGANTYSLSGNYTDTLLTATGKDSIIHTQITVIEYINYSQSITICEGDTLIVANNEYYNTGSYIDTIQVTNGCDSIITTYLNVNENYFISETFAILPGDSVKVGNNYYFDEGTYIDTLVSTNGCDSIITSILTIFTDIKEIYSNPKFVIAPNPLVEKTIIRFNIILEDAILNVYTMDGKLISQKINLNGETIILNRGSIPQGMYLIEVLNKGSIVGRRKLMIM